MFMAWKIFLKREEKKMIPELVSTEQVARILHCSRHTVGTLRKLGILPGIRLGHGYQYDPADVIKALDLM